MESSLAAEGLASKLSYCFLTGLFKVQMSGGEGLFYFFLTNINPCIYFSYMNTGKGANRAHILKRCKDTVSSSSLKSFCVFMSSEFAFITTSFVPLSSSFCKKKGKMRGFFKSRSTSEQHNSRFNAFWTLDKLKGYLAFLNFWEDDLWCLFLILLSYVYKMFSLLKRCCHLFYGSELFLAGSVLVWSRLGSNFMYWFVFLGQLACYTNMGKKGIRILKKQDNEIYRSV